MKILVIIPAYNAERTIQRAIDSIRDQRTRHDIDIVVVDDCSDNILNVTGAKVIRNAVNVGCYQSVNRALYENIQSYDAWLIHGADDYSSQDRIEKQAGVLEWGSGCLYLRDGEKFGHSTMMYSKKVFDVLGYYDNSRFGADTEYHYRFSRLFPKQIVDECLYFTDGSGLTDKYNTKQRLEYVENFKKEGITKREYFNERVIVGIASINQGLLEKTVDSLIDQCDEMIIGLNNYKDIPGYLNHGKIKSYLLDNSLGDAAKFLNINTTDGWYLSADDDLIYPKDYASYMINKSKEYNTLVTAHGRRMKKGKLPSFYKGHSEVFNCLTENKEDSVIDIAGSGVSCFHTSMADVRLEDFKYPNMADIYLSSYFKKIICVKHKEDWLTYQPHHERIFLTYKNNELIQTSEYNRLIA